jgi:isoquinoline 1-oxidoreductase subunit alpha
LHVGPIPNLNRNIGDCQTKWWHCDSSLAGYDSSQLTWSNPAKNWMLFADAMNSFRLTVNGKRHYVAVPPDTPLLWVLRDTLGFTGTKYGCGMGLCGACTVHLKGQAIRSCQMPIKSVGSRRVTTIEGLSRDGTHAIQRAWIAEQVPQCGYCQSGQIMQAAALLAQIPHPTREQIDQAMSGNICRCATYQRIRQAIRRAAEEKA